MIDPKSVLEAIDELNAVKRAMGAKINELEGKLDAVRKVVKNILHDDYIDESWSDWRTGDGHVSDLMAILDMPKEPE